MYDDCLIVSNCLNTFKGCVIMSTRSFHARIGHGRANVVIEYSAERDYDERGNFWDVDWDNVKVFLFEINIADALGDSEWQEVQEEINEDLPS